MATQCINDLPDEILEFIFGHMPPYKDLESCALVCKRWTTIVRSECTIEQFPISNSNLISCLLNFFLPFFSLISFIFFFCFFIRCTTSHTNQFPQRSVRFSFVLEALGSNGHCTSYSWTIFSFGCCV